MTRAAETIDRVGAGRFGLGGQAAAELGEGECLALLVQTLPALRGALLADADGVVLEVDRSPAAVAFASSARAPEVSQVGAPCPDHLDEHKAQATRRRLRPRDATAPATLADVSAARGRRSTARGTATTTRRNSTTRHARSRSIPSGPRVTIIPGVGIVTSGADAARARTTRDLYHRAIAVQDAADALGGFRSLSEAEAFAIEYWPLERYKLAQAAPRGDCSRADRADHRRRERHRTGHGAAARRARRSRRRRGPERGRAPRGRERARRHAYGIRRALAVDVDVTSEAQVVGDGSRRTVLEYGGLDFLVASAGLATSAPVTETTLDEWERSYAVLARGYFLAGRGAFRVLIEQGRGGSIVFVGSKNALVAGANAAAYSSAKAAALHLGRCLAEEGGPQGIRVNTVNPDAVIQGSSIWSSDWKAERASTYGVSEDELQTYYQRRTKLGVAVLPEDVAEAIAFFVGPSIATNRQEMSSTSTAASPPHIPGSAKEAHPCTRLMSQTSTRKDPSMHVRRWAVFAAAFLVAGVAVAAALGGPSRSTAGKTFYFIPKDTLNPYEVIADRGGKLALTELGEKQVVQSGTEDTAAAQQPAVQAAIQAHAAGIVIAGNDPDALCPALKQAQAAGTHVIAFDSDVSCRELFINQADTETIGRSQVAAARRS